MSRTLIVLDPPEITAGLPEVPQETNLASNPRGAVDAAGWSKSAPAWWLNTTAAAPAVATGASAASLNDGSSYLYETTSGSATFQGLALPVTGPFHAGVEVIARVQVYGYPGKTRQAFFGDASADSVIVSTTGDGWQEVTLRWTPATTRATAYIGVRQPAATADTIEITNVMVGPSADTPYFDGDVPGYEWAGTAHASASAPVPLPRVPLHLHSDGSAIVVDSDGIDWGDAAVDQYLADLRLGQIPIDYRVPNRTITIPLLVGASGAGDYAAAWDALRTKVALIQRSGGWIKRGEGLYADLVGATLSRPDRHGHLGVESDVVLTLDAIPDFYGDERQATGQAGDVVRHFWTATDGVVDVYLDGIEGDFPGRVRIVVESGSDTAQRGLIGAIRAAHYDSDPTAAAHYLAAQFTPLDSAAVDGDGITHPGISTRWTPVLSTDLVDGGDALTHRGSIKVWAQLESTAATPPRARLVWGVGALDSPIENAAVRLPGSDGLYLLCLGEVRLDAAPVGVHRWRGVIQAAGDLGGEDFTIQHVFLAQVDDAYWELRAPDSTISTELAGYEAVDGFTDTTAGAALDGHAAPVGGAWDTLASPDFEFSDPTNPYGPSTEAIVRSENGTTPGYAVLGPVLAAQRVRVDHGLMTDDVLTPLDPAGYRGVVARWNSINAFLWLTISPVDSTFGAFASLELGMRLPSGGGYTQAILASAVLTGPIASGSQPVTLDLSVTADGHATGRVLDLAGNELETVTAFSAQLSAGGTLEDGHGGIVDAGDGTHEPIRWYDNFAVTTPPAPSAVIHPGRNLEISTDGMFREVSDGDSYGKVPHTSGDLPRLPPTPGLGKLGVFIKTSRGDLDRLPEGEDDDDDLTVRVFYRPSFIFPITADS
jgi:hypothetical protein